MKIALYNLTTTTRWGGVETFVWEVADQMARRGHRVVVFGGRGPRQLRRQIPGVKVRLYPYIDRDLWRKVPLLGRQYTLTKLLERLSMAPFALPALLMGGFDIVHIQKPYDLPVGALAKLSGAKLLFGCHGKDFWMGDRLFTRFVDGAVSASRFNASQVRARYGLNPVVIYNGVDLQRFSTEGEDDSAILAKHGLTPPTPEHPALLYAGRLVRWKGVEYLVRALPLISPDAQLWIAGEGTYRDTLEKLARDAGVATRVRFLGKVEQDDLAALYRSCAMLVATSFVNETFGMSLCEAMACGAAVVASDFGGFKEVVVPGVTGLLARPQDPADLADKIKTLLADPSHRRRMGQAGRERVISVFSWQAVANRLSGIMNYELGIRNYSPLRGITNYELGIRNYHNPIHNSVAYVAYPMRLDLSAANAIQTFNTVRELQAILPGVRLVIPRWLHEKSAFSALNTLHLPRPAVNKLSRLVPWAGWSYIERTLYSFMLVLLLASLRLVGRGYRVLYVRDTVCAAWLCLLQWLHGSRVIYEAHDLEASHPSKASRWPRPFWAAFLPWLDRCSLGRACKVVSLTQTFKDWLVAGGMRRDAGVVVIADAFDPAIYFPLDMGQAREKLGLPSGAFIVGYAGLTFAYRRLDLLLAAAARLMKEDEDLLLLIVGGRAAEVGELRAIAARLGIAAERLITPGQVGQPHTALYLNASDLLVIPDTVTGMTASPLKLFEYMAVGKPLVCKDMPALREIVDDSCAAFFAGGDAGALASAIEVLRSDGGRRIEMGEAARRQAAAHTYRRRAEKIAEVARSCK